MIIPWQDRSVRRVAFAAATPFVLLVAGTAGYHFIEGWSLFDGLYMTVITLATVGYLEVHELSVAGRWFTMALVLSGVFTMAAAVTSVISAIVSGELNRLVGKQRMEQKLNAMKDHMIVCGYGRMGRLVCDEFTAAKVPFVVVDRDVVLLENLPGSQGIALPGDATTDDVLKRAGIDRARALVSVVPHDADNLFITMSARLLNEKLFIVARAEEPASEPKLVRAGANRVVAPYLIGGGRVVQAVLRPAVLDFIDLATKTQHIELQMEETSIAAGSALENKKLSTMLSRDDRIIVVAIKRKSGKMDFNPGGDAQVESGDTIISLGHRHDLDRLDKLAEAPASS